MGAQSSKPEGSSTQHVFSSDTPIQVSPTLLSALQASTETNSTRAKSLELHIQQKVAEELERIKRHEDERLASIREKIQSEANSTPPHGEKETVVERVKDTLAAHNPLQPGGGRGGKETSTQSVQTEIQRLQKTLAERRVLGELPGEVKEAREELVKCLRVNDRRPLDCWREVQRFKDAVGGMEERFVGSLL